MVTVFQKFGETILIHHVCVGGDSVAFPNVLSNPVFLFLLSIKDDKIDNLKFLNAWRSVECLSPNIGGIQCTLLFCPRFQGFLTHHCFKAFY